MAYNDEKDDEMLDPDLAEELDDEELDDEDDEDFLSDGDEEQSDRDWGL